MTAPRPDDAQPTFHTIDGCRVYGVQAPAEGQK